MTRPGGGGFSRVCRIVVGGEYDGTEDDAESPES